MFQALALRQKNFALCVVCHIHHTEGGTEWGHNFKTGLIIKGLRSQRENDIGHFLDISGRKIRDF